MNNFALFICGLAITLFSGLGIVVYTVALGYEQNDKKKKNFETDIDLGASLGEAPNNL